MLTNEDAVLREAKRIRMERVATRRLKRKQDIIAQATELDTGKRYPIIYADPPWQYWNRLGSTRDVENHYPTMTLEQLCSLPVANLATDHAVLFIWATAPKLPDCLKVIESWGFEYTTNLVWVKDRIGMGYQVRGQHELLMIAKRGQVPVPEAKAKPPSVIFSPRRGHSQKPPEAYAVIEQMYPDLPRIELFGRNARQGWSLWGNQIHISAVLPI